MAASTCAWCESPIPARARRDSVCCSVPCRQARWRFLRAVGRAEAVAGSLRLAYADPPYPGKAQLRSRSACSSRHAARDTRSSTRRSRCHAAVRSAIFMHTACPACTVQQSGHAGGVHSAVLTDTPIRTTPTRRRSPGYRPFGA